MYVYFNFLNTKQEIKQDTIVFLEKSMFGFGPDFEDVYRCKSFVVKDTWIANSFSAQISRKFS